jgi:hypothetical protein
MGKKSIYSFANGFVVGYSGKKNPEEAIRSVIEENRAAGRLIRVENAAEADYAVYDAAAIFKDALDENQFSENWIELVRAQPLLGYFRESEDD